MTTKPPDAKTLEAREVISAGADVWIRQFIKHLEMQLVGKHRGLPANAGVAELRMATARAVLETLVESGMDIESAIELFGQAVVESRAVDVSWDDTLNQRRFALIDKEIQGMLSPSESIELAGLTRMMRDHAELETNLPTQGARALHRKLLQLRPTGESD